MALQTWRILLPRLADPPMDLDEELFQALLALEQKQSQQNVRWDEANSWSVNQNEGSVTLFFQDMSGEETELTAKVQIIGTFHTDTFLWAWNNPSIHDELKADSLQLKAYGEKHGWAIFTEPSFASTPRDGYAVMALAAKLLDKDGAYAARGGGGTVSYLTLSEYPESTNPSLEQPQYEAPSIIETLERQIAIQVGNVQLSLSELRAVENICRRGFVESLSGEQLVAAQSFEEAWAKLGKHAVDQEPAAWIKLAKGNALFLAGNYNVALATLLEAEKLYGGPDPALLYQRMGQCYSALDETEKSIEMFARVYVIHGTEGLQELSSKEKNPFITELEKRRKQAKARLGACDQKRGTDKLLNDATAIVSCMIRELNSFEINAHDRKQEASKSRKISSEICEQEVEVRNETNSQWTWLMAVWCTPFRSPICTVLQSPPAHDPALEKIQKAYRVKDDRIAVDTTTIDIFGLENNWRYELKEVDGLLLIDQIFSVWDDEDLPSI